MADNVPITAGSGTNIATDEVSGTLEHIQLFKLAVSADGSRTLIPADATNGILVDVSRITGALPAGSNMIGKIDLSDGTNDAVIDVSASDAESATTPALVTNARLKGYNGTGWDRVRSTVNTNKTAQYTAAQTGTALWTPAAGLAVVITALQIQVGGTVAGAVQVWFGGSADTTYTRGTDFPIFDGEFVPSATNKPGVYVTFPTPVRGAANFVLRVTTAAAINPITVSVWGYEV